MRGKQENMLLFPFWTNHVDRLVSKECSWAFIPVSSLQDPTKYQIACYESAQTLWNLFEGLMENKPLLFHLFSLIKLSID